MKQHGSTLIAVQSDRVFPSRIRPFFIRPVNACRWHDFRFCSLHLFLVKIEHVQKYTWFGLKTLEQTMVFSIRFRGFDLNWTLNYQSNRSWWNPRFSCSNRTAKSLLPLPPWLRLLSPPILRFAMFLPVKSSIPNHGCHSCPVATGHRQLQHRAQ